MSQVQLWEEALGRSWLLNLIVRLRDMPLDDRLLWRATKHGGSRLFNYQQLDEALKEYPDLMPEFIKLGMYPHAIWR